MTEVVATRQPAWLVGGAERKQRASQRPSVYVPQELLTRWREVEARGRLINASALFQEALGRALDTLDERDSWVARR